MVAARDITRIRTSYDLRRWRCCNSEMWRQTTQVLPGGAPTGRINFPLFLISKFYLGKDLRFDFCLVKFDQHGCGVCVLKSWMSFVIGIDRDVGIKFDFNLVKFDQHGGGICVLNSWMSFVIGIDRGVGIKCA